MDGKPIIVWGGGSWGTALGALAARSGCDVRLLVRRAEQVGEINSRHANSRYLPDVQLPPNIVATSEYGVLAEASIIILAIPVQALRSALMEQTARGRFSPGTVFVNAAKGFERGTLAAPSRIVAECLADTPYGYAMLSGPSFAIEVARGLPTAVVLGCEDAELGAGLRQMFSEGHFRAYSSTDVCGVECGGAVKNIIAIAAGVCDGLGLGHNARAALVTRGLAEITRLGVALGARPETFMGLSGLGDLMLTCTGDLSRNRRVGLKLGANERLTEILASLGTVAEGVATTFAVSDLASKYHVEMPITNAVRDILEEKCTPMEAVECLFARPLREEWK